MTTKNVFLESVADLMSTHIVSLPAGSSMHDAIELMVENRVSALPIVDMNNTCIGIITTTDLIEVTYDIDSDLSHLDPIDPSGSRRLISRISNLIGSEPVESYASETIASTLQSASLVAAAKLMTKEQIHHLPVVDEGGQLVGILSSMDLVAAMGDCELPGMA